MINQLADQVYKNAIEKGFYENGNATNIGERIALIHGEVSEALEADREDRYCKATTEMINGFEDNDEFIQHYKWAVKGTFEEEMADIVLRVMDMCAFKNIDLEGHLIAKMRYNKSREKYHGKKY